MLRAILLSANLLMYEAQALALPTEEEYRRLLHASIAKHDGPAEEAITHVIESSDKSSPDDQFQLGTALMRIRAHFRAIEVLSRATQLAPQNAVAFANLGISYHTVGNCEDAVRVLAKSVELDPRGSRAGGSYQMMGSCMFLKRDYARTEEYCAKGKDLLPTDPAPRLCLGRVQYLQARYADALATYIAAHAMASNIHPPYRVDAESGILASLAKLNRLSEAQRMLMLTEDSSPASIERRAAFAARQLESNRKPPW